MKKSNDGKCFKVVLTEELYEEANQIAQECFTSVDEIVQKSVELHLICKRVKKRKRNRHYLNEHFFPYYEIDSWDDEL